MALNRPFAFAIQVAISANSVNTGSFLVGVGMIYDLEEIFSDTATSGVNILGLRDSTGLSYTSAGTNTPIPIAQLITPAKSNPSSLLHFAKPLNLVGQAIFLIDLQNTTGGAVTVNLVTKGFLTIQGAP